MSFESVMTKLGRIFKVEAIQEYVAKSSDGTFHDFFDDWRWIFTFSKRHKWIIVFYTVLGLLSSTLGLGGSYISAMLVNIITSNDVSQLGLLIGLMLGMTVFSLAFSCVMSRVNARISIYVNNEIQGEIFDKIIDAKWSEINRYKNGDILNRFNGDVSTVSGNAISWIPNLIINIYTFVITFIVLFNMDWIMAMIALASAPVLVLLSHYIMRKQREYRKRVLEMNSDMMSFEVEAFYNFDVIKSFGVARHYSRGLRDWQRKYKEYNLDYNGFEIKTNIIMTALSTTVAMIAFGYCLWRLWTGGIQYGDMMFFMQQRSALSTNFQSLVSTIPAMLNSSISAHRIRELVDLEKEEHDPESLEALRNVERLGLEMRGVTYSYVEGEHVYKDATFGVHSGEMVAVLGESGGGKTTMFRLLLGLVRPQEGSVVLRDESGVLEFPMNADLRELVSYVPQGNTAILGTIAENLRMVRSDATDEQIIDALKAACAWDFVEPIGINTQLGERGQGISEGQAQRLSIARALLRDAPILMLDEATSALDSETEEMVLDSIVEHSPGKAIIVATHRPSVLSRCARIYKIADKTISEQEGVGKGERPGDDILRGMSLGLGFGMRS